jgi:flagellar biosynthesis/type III secretory pathway protein FliH
MSLAAFAALRDFSEPDELPAFEAEAEEADDRLSPAEVAELIENARRTAYEEGRAAGRAEGEAEERTSIAARLDGAVSELTGHLGEIRAREEELFARLESRTSRLILALVHQLARKLSEKEAQRLAEDVTMRALSAVRGKQEVTIRAAEAFLPALRAVLRMPTDEEAAAHRIRFEAVAADEGALLEVAWLTGKVTFDPYAFTGAIDEVFTQTLESLTEGETNPPTFGE